MPTLSALIGIVGTDLVRGLSSIALDGYVPVRVRMGLRHGPVCPEMGTALDLGELCEWAPESPIVAS